MHSLQAIFSYLKLPLETQTRKFLLRGITNVHPEFSQIIQIF